MNIKLSASILGLGILTSLTLVNINPVAAQNNSGSDNGNNINAISFPTIVPPSPVVPPVVGNAIQAQAGVLSPAAVPPSISQALTGNPVALIAALTPPPTSILPNAPAGAGAAVTEAAANLAKSLDGLIVTGFVNASRLNGAVSAFNDYVAKLVAAVGGTEAVAIMSKQTELRTALTTLVNAAVTAAGTYR
jgi:hypothetical protein